MTEPLNYELDFSGKLPPSAQDGMARADENASDRWKRWVDGAIQVIATRQAEFTVDDVLAYLETLYDPPNTHNLAALGPRMKRVSKELGYMTATNQVKRYKRQEKKGKLHREWKKKLYGK